MKIIKISLLLIAVATQTNAADWSGMLQTAAQAATTLNSQSIKAPSAPCGSSAAGSLIQTAMQNPQLVTAAFNYAKSNPQMVKSLLQNPQVVTALTSMVKTNPGLLQIALQNPQLAATALQLLAPTARK